MIPRLEPVDRGRFDAASVTLGKPAISTRALDGRERARWTPAWGVAQAPERDVELGICTNRIFDFDHQQDIFGSRIERVKNYPITSGMLLVVVGAGQIAADTCVCAERRSPVARSRTLRKVRNLGEKDARC